MFLFQVSLGNIFLSAVFSCLSIRTITILARGRDIQMVMVAKIRPHWDNKQAKAVFDHFFSALPDNCLAIPFSDSCSREAVCKSLLSMNKSFMASLIVDPDRRVLEKEPFFWITICGAPSFPSPAEYFATREGRLDEIRSRLCYFCSGYYSDFLAGSGDADFTAHNLVTLDELFESKPLREIWSAQEVELSAFGNRLIGLYLCYDGRLLDELMEVHRECLAQGKDFVIVLVYMPFEPEQEPSSFSNHIKRALKKRNISASWLEFPFDDTIGRKLWQLCDSKQIDRLVILPHDDKYGNRKYGDLHGRSVLEMFGAAAYPFTREAILERIKAHLKSINLMSLLSSEFTHLVLNNSNVPLDDLRGRKILLYLDSVHELHPILHDHLLSLYQDMKLKHRDSEVIFVPLEWKSDKPEDGLISAMPWPRLPGFSDSLIKQLFYMGTELCDATHASPALIPFDENGNIVGRNGSRLLGIEELFRDTLHRDLFGELERLQDEEY